MKFNDDWLNRAADEIDAAIFSADTFANSENRTELRRLMARWERGIVEFDCPPPCPRCGGTGEDLTTQETASWGEGEAKCQTCGHTYSFDLLTRND
jgi:hypothetical protein